MDIQHRRPIYELISINIFDQRRYLTVLEGFGQFIHFIFTIVGHVVRLQMTDDRTKSMVFSPSLFLVELGFCCGFLCIFSYKLIISKLRTKRTLNLNILFRLYFLTEAFPFV